MRVDMSELVTGAAIARLITPSPAGTSLADRIRRQPLSVVLFDEIEKADAAAFDLLLGVLGEGRLTDALGRLVDFRMAVIVMTTQPRRVRSAARRLLVGAAGHRRSRRRDPRLLPARAPRPHRLGRGVPPLGPPALEKIVELELDKVRRRPGLTARNLRLEVTPAARARPRAAPATIPSSAPAPCAGPSKIWWSYRSRSGWPAIQPGGTRRIRIAAAPEPADISV